MRRMFDLLKGIPRKQQFLRLNSAFRSDMVWWQVFLERWNGASMMPTKRETPQFHLIIDASGSFGCGAYSGNRWLTISVAGQSGSMVDCREGVNTNSDGVDAVGTALEGERRIDPVRQQSCG